MTESSHTKLDWIDLEGGGRVARISLNRPEQANAFSGQMMSELADHFKALKTQNDVRVLVLSGTGKHFSAGADLSWMKDAAQLSFEQNVTDASKLRTMFEELVQLSIPKIASIRGAVYGGAVGLVAACDFAIADISAKFCLSEAKLGLLPAVIAPYLLRKIHAGQLKRLALTADVFNASDALSFGLVEIVADNLEEAVNAQINSLLKCGPTAQKSINQLFDQLRLQNNSQCEATVQAISRARTSPEGQDGLKAFFDKSTPPWVRHIS